MDTSCSGVVYDAWLASASIPQSLLARLLSYYHSPEGCFEAFDRQDPELRDLLPPRFLSVLESGRTKDQLSRMSVLIEKYGIRSMHRCDAEYPESLEEVDDPPAILFYQGNPDCFQKPALTIVGSRAASYQGMKAARKIACDLSSSGVAVVSGLACGIDASAHLGCLEGGSPTIAVMGCGLDRIYPSENHALHDRILAEGGLILSEYAPGEKPAGWHFPYRNRILSGLGLALAVIECRIRSGSMTSVRHALDQGKDVFVYPGDPERDSFEGNHQLLREGAIYFTSAEDILTDLHLLDNRPRVGQNSGCSDSLSFSSPEEKTIYDALLPGRRSFEQLVSCTGLDPSVILSTLTVLQISGVVEALPGKQYQLTQ